MQMNRWLAKVAVAAVLGTLGSGAAWAQMGKPMGGHMGGQPSAPQVPRGSEMNPGLSPKVMEPMILTDDQVKNFFDAAEEMRAKADEAKAADPSGKPAAAKGAEMSAEHLAIITKHGFKDATEFQQVGYNIGMARSVLQQGGKEEVKKRLDKAQAEQAKTVDKVRGQLSPEQLKTLQSQGAAAIGRAREMESIPDSNLEIVKKYESRMKPVGKK